MCTRGSSYYVQGYYLSLVSLYLYTYIYIYTGWRRNKMGPQLWSSRRRPMIPENQGNGVWGMKKPLPEAIRRICPEKKVRASQRSRRESVKWREFTELMITNRGNRGEKDSILLYIIPLFIYRGNEIHSQRERASMHHVVCICIFIYTG